MRFDRLVGVYNADGTILGELSYVVGRARGRTHCALCDVTHGKIRRRSDFDAAAEGFPFTLELLHRDEVDDVVRRGCGARFPCVVGVTGGSAEMLLDADDLEACSGDPAALFARLGQILGVRRSETL